MNTFCAFGIDSKGLGLQRRMLHIHIMLCMYSNLLKRQLLNYVHD